jgi:uncharacterized protein (TIGR02598 family)
MKIKINKNGFTLVETVIAMAITSIAIAAILNGIIFGIFQMRMSRDNSRATQVMIEKFETLRLYNWDQLHSTNGYIPVKFTNDIFTGTVIISDVPFICSYSTNMCQFEITLEWNTEPIHRIRTMTTLAAKNGLQSYVY